MKNLSKQCNEYAECLNQLLALRIEYINSSGKDKSQKAEIKAQIAEKKEIANQLYKNAPTEIKSEFTSEKAYYQERVKLEYQKKLDKKESVFFRKVNPAYVYMIPAGFGAIFFTILPFIFMIVGSFFKVDLVTLSKSKFKGFWNYEMIFTRDTEFVKAIGNTIIFAFLTVVLLMFVTVTMAAWLQNNTKIHNFSQTLIFTPHISSMVAVSILWVLMLDPNGIINQVLAIFGIEGPSWLLDKRTSLLSVAMVTVWKSIGYYVLLIIAGMQNLPPDVYEAAKLDKASKMTIFRRITLPLLAPTLSFVFVMKFINAFKSFAAIDLMTQGGPQGSSMVLGYWIYTTGRVKFNYGFSMAGALVLTVIVVVFTFFVNKLFKGGRRDD